MIGTIDIRESAPHDVESIGALYPTAFPEEDLLPLVRDLLAATRDTLSLVGIMGNVLAGHIVFTICSVARKPDKVALLGPLAVAPACQRQGVGAALIHAGMRRMETAGMRRIFVLGDPGYYGRFGFAPDDGVTPPYRLPEEWRDAWQSHVFGDNGGPLQGELSVPQPWRHPALWEG